MKLTLNIRQAVPADLPAVKDFYRGLIRAMADAEYRPGWEWDVYPTREFLQESIENGELFVGETGEKRMAACMVVNQKYNDGYSSANWSIQAQDEELFVIHALGVHPDFSGKGLAKRMVQEVIDLARKRGVKTIRLDVLGGNLPAEKVYTKMNFQYVDTIRMFYEDTGWTDFRLFELAVK